MTLCYSFVLNYKDIPTTVTKCSPSCFRPRHFALNLKHASWQLTDMGKIQAPARYTHILHSNKTEIGNIPCLHKKQSDDDNTILCISRFLILVRD